MMKARFAFRLAFVVLGAAVVAVSASPAQATSLSDKSIDVQELPHFYPSSVELAPHTVLIEALTGSSSAVAQTDTCSYEYLCLYGEANQIGWMYSFHDCGFYDLRLIDYPGGGKWNDKASSWVDNQTGGMKSTYYNWDGIANWIPVFSESAPSYGNFADYQVDNIIDGVRLC